MLKGIAVSPGIAVARAYCVDAVLARARSLDDRVLVTSYLTLLGAALYVRGEWEAGRLPGSLQLGKGVIERDIEQHFPDRSTPIVCYCGGGYRSVLACENLQRMGYRDVRSLAGGYRGWVAAGLPVETDETE